MVLTERTFERGYKLADVALVESGARLGGKLIGVLHSDRGSFVYKFAPGQPWTLRGALVLDYLRDKGFEHSPRLLHTREGGQVLRLDGGEVMVMERVEGDRPPPTSRNYRQLGEIVGRLNRFTDCPVDCAVVQSLVMVELEVIAERLGPYVDRDRFRTYVRGLTDFATLPQTLIHFEMGVANTVLRPDGVIVGVDWDEAGVGPRILDPGYFLISAFVSEGLAFDHQAACAFYEGYASQIAMSRAEREALFDASLYHALRYIVSGNTAARWRRIVWADEHRKELMAAVR